MRCVLANFLDTAGVSFYLQKLINNANEKLILISPYLKISDRLKQSIEDKDRMKIDIRFVYGKSEIELSENNWLKTLSSVRTSYCQNLHAKCYLNETETIITSMNLYEFSQVNNNEMGIYVNKEEDPELYSDIFTEVMRLVRISDEIRVSVTRIPKNDQPIKTKKDKLNGNGFCIRCKAKIKRNPMSPYCIKCYQEYKTISNPDFQEMFCHICGKENKSSLNKPTCYKCYKSKKTELNFPSTETKNK